MVEFALRLELTKKAQTFRTLEPVAQLQKQYAQEKQRYKFLVLDEWETIELCDRVISNESATFTI